MLKLNANRIHHNLFQGGELPHGVRLQPNEVFAMRDGQIVQGFHAVVLCAQELQPRGRLGQIYCPHVIHAPIDDDSTRPMNCIEKQLVVRAAREVFQHLHRRENTLVTCHAGLNRSGLVSALSLMMLTACPPPNAIRLIQAKRTGALGNQRHIEFLFEFWESTRSPLVQVR